MGWAVGDFNRDVLPIDLAMGLARSVPRLGYRVTPRLAPVDSNDTAPGLETMPVAPGLAVVVVVADRGLVHQLQRNGVRVCDVAQFGALPVTAEMMDDAGLPRHAAAFRRWHDVDHDRPSPGDDITRAAFDAMDGAP